MAKKKTYDVFISYRREGGLDFARSIACHLRIEGYQCFFDQRELKTGQFNQQIFEAIENSRHFVIVLTPGALDRCANPDDWVRAEIEHAHKMGVHVVPVAPRGDLAYPDSLPESLAWLKTQQASYIDRGTDFEDTIAKMVRNQLADLDGMSTSRQRQRRRQAEKVFLEKAARFKDNGGVIDETERVELERLANASGISRNRLEELVEMVEAAAVARAKRKAWMKKHTGLVALSGLVLFLLIAGLAVKIRPPVPSQLDSPLPAEEPLEAETVAPCEAVPLPQEGKTVPSAGDAPEADSPQVEPPAPPTEKPSGTTTAKRETVAPSGKTSDEPDAIQAASAALAKLSPKWREYAEADFRNSLKTRKMPDYHGDSVATQIVTEYVKVAAEGRQLHRLGMHPKELVTTRPDLVLKFAELRSKVRNELRQLIKDNKQAEALRYYNSARKTFEALGMQPLSRPTFSN